MEPEGSLPHSQVLGFGWLWNCPQKYAHCPICSTVL